MREQDLTNNRMRQVNVTENLEVRDREKDGKRQRGRTLKREREQSRKLNVFNL
jgi:hypothetical protein